MPFRLDLLRHGSALPAQGGSDSARRLSPVGRAEVERVAELFARNRWRPDAVFVSPLSRARETAAILARAVPGVDPEILDELVPDHEPEALIAALVARGVLEYAVLIGHQPLLGRLAAYLTGASEPSLPPAGLIRITFEERIAAGEGKLVN